MAHRFDHITGNISNFKESIHLPLFLKYGGFLMCTTGESDATLDNKRYRIKQWDMMVAFPHSTVQLQHYTTDFEGVIIGAGIDFFSNFDMPNRATIFTSIKESPCISLTASEGEKILSLQDMLLREQGDTQLPFRNEIVESVLKIIFYETITIYSRRKPNNERHRSHEEALFNSFITRLFKDYHTYRTLEYYAQYHSITPNHLARVVKRVSGRRATEWINECTILNIKNRLQNKRITVSDIAEEFNFPNASFFSQYFKRHTGITPSQYRAGIGGTTAQ